MRKPLPGEKPSGHFEKTMYEMGRENWKLEPHEIVLLRRELEKALDERKRLWLAAFQKKGQPPDA